MNEEPPYKEAFDELQQIVKEVENDAIPLDVLSEKVKRATLLIKICRAQLSMTELDVNKILEEMEEK